jgi:hypothetical protein
MTADTQIDNFPGTQFSERVCVCVCKVKKWKVNQYLKLKRTFLSPVPDVFSLRCKPEACVTQIARFCHRVAKILCDFERAQ